MTKQPFFKKYSNIDLSSSNASVIHEQGLYFGNNPDMTRAEKNTIINIFSEFGK